MKNPFQFGKIIQDDAFCNRKEELVTIKKYIKNGYSVWLYSPRRYGKTSLIYKTFRETKDVHTIYFDLYNIHSLDEFLNRYAEKITKSLFNWKDDLKQFTNKIGRFFTGLSPKFSIDCEGNYSMELDVKHINNQKNIDTILNAPELIAQKKNVKICIAFDEFQEVNHIHPQLIHWMRSVFQNQTAISYIFLGSKQSLMDTIFTDTKSVFYEFGIKMNLLPISNTDWLEYIKNKFNSTNLDITENVILQILEKSKGHPHFTQYFASVVWDLVFEEYNQDDVNFSQIWMDKIIESQTIIFQNIFDNLKKNHRKILVALANSNDDVKIFSSAIKSQFKLPANSTLGIGIKSLIEKDIISKDIFSHYYIVNPVFNEWIRRL